MPSKKEKSDSRAIINPSYWDNVLMEEFQKETDRGAVILVATLFDLALDSLLRNYFVPISSSSDDLFDSANAPLSTFSAKISLAFRLSLISQKFARDMHLIRKIRNEFAHSIQDCNFQQTKVISRIEELRKSSGIIDKNPTIRKNHEDGARGDFLIISSWMIFCLRQKIQNIKGCKQAQDEWGYLDESIEENAPDDLKEKIKILKEKNSN